MRTKELLQRHKYELLLFALAQHLFIGIFITDMLFYTTYIWPVNMFILGIASIGIFMKKGRVRNVVKNLLFLFALVMPIMLPFIGKVPYFMQALSVIYALFFVLIFWELMRFLVKPGYINADIISAAACGYLLLIEVSVFLFQSVYYFDPLALKGIDATSPASVYTDIVYFCSITITSIGYGDILPNTHYAKLFASLFGIAGQFYSVVLVGILISKFSI